VKQKVSTNYLEVDNVQSWSLRLIFTGQLMSAVCTQYSLPEATLYLTGKQQTIIGLDAKVVYIITFDYSIRGSM
jgi:hypothetical protein